MSIRDKIVFIVGVVVGAIVMLGITSVHAQGVVDIGAKERVFTLPSVSNTGPVGSLRMTTGGVTSRVITATCEEGWTMVLRSPGDPVCAKEVREVIWK